LRARRLALFSCRYGELEKPDPELLPVHRPLCPKCQKRMTTTAVSDGPAGFELRRFECLKCTVIETRTPASDPLKSDALLCIGQNGHFIRPIDLRCADDSAAIEFAKQLIDGHALELWQRDRHYSAVWRQAGVRPPL
jgi:hypothetical protein